MAIFPKLETERLQLVEIGEQFCQNYYDIMSREVVTKYYGMESLKTLEEASKIIEFFNNSFNSRRGIRWGIVLKENQEFIGTIGLNSLNIPSKKS